MSIWIRAVRVRFRDTRQLSRLEAKPLLEPDEPPELATPQTVLLRTESADRLIVRVSYIRLCARPPTHYSSPPTNRKKCIDTCAWSLTQAFRIFFQRAHLPLDAQSGS